MPRLWTETIEGHRRAVRDATLDTTAALVAQHGRAVTMSRIAEETGIGRATLYKYFADIDEILLAWHERQIADHLGLLKEVRDTSNPAMQVKSVLTTYAHIRYAHHGLELAEDLHRGEHVTRARHELLGFLQALIADTAAIAGIRTDVSPKELANFCVHALDGAADVGSQRAADRLVRVVLAALHADT